MKSIGFIVNPIAGLGGRVGLKGTDDMLDEAVRRGAEPQAPERAARALAAVLAAAGDAARATRWLTAGETMGERELGAAGIGNVEVVHRQASASTSSHDTIAAAKEMARRKIDLILFAGGDGTARDILSAAGRDTPMLGIPAGVKMHSGMFAETPEAAGEVVAHLLAGAANFADAEVLDLDEEAYRRGEWKVALFGVARVPQEPELVACGKMANIPSEEEDLKGIAEHVREEMVAAPETLFIFGPGSTTEFIAKYCELPKTLLGIDAYRATRPVSLDLDGAGLDRLAADAKDVALVLSPIGGQGFVVGRGNAPISSTLVSRVWPERSIACGGMCDSAAGWVPPGAIESSPNSIQSSSERVGPDAAFSGR